MSGIGPAPARALAAIVGPTAAGKSDLALALAEKLGGEVVSCDALQVYRGLDIGTAKLLPSDRRGIPHHLVDVVEATEEFSAAEFVHLAVPVIEDIANRRKLPILVGGTGLYLRALRRGLFEGPGRSPLIRDRLMRIADRRGGQALHRILRRWDPDLAKRIHENDRVRLVRGIEVFLRSGRKMSDLMRTRERPLRGFQDILVGLRPGREALKARVEARVDAMFNRGFIDEVRGLRARHGGDVPAFKAIGYREVNRHLDGEIDAEDARRLTVLSTIQYAKRQMTWFRREPDVQWFEGEGDDPAVEARVLDWMQSTLPAASELQKTGAFPC
ncbi:MAG TPA: tRNA (adenosine(37)-N6)-dimethylallyltransferase MiaA [Vicinamibacteria bacterium]|jgi:tRNA dimethylallyltransferase